MTASAHPLPAARPEPLRRFDVSRDLNAVADLIERCFSDTLDVDGQSYLRQMRTAAQNPGFLRWASSVADRVSLPLSGFVWEENGQVVGNLSLIRMAGRGERVSLIANVAVDPTYRRRGIARALTEAALDEVARLRRTDSVWLQVREENAVARHLYGSLGFEERARRTTWWKREGYWPVNTVPGVRVRDRQANHWGRQKRWLEQLYPARLSWNLRINVRVLRPGLRGALSRLFSGAYVRQWSALRGRELIGVLAWQPTGWRRDSLWLAAPADEMDLAARSLVGHARASISRQRVLSLDLPAGLGAGALESVGFEARQTLLWMRLESH